MSDSATIQKIKVLLVDDNEIIRIFFRDIFWLHGLDEKFELIIADGLEPAKKYINDAATRPDIIFLDLMMPMEKNGSKITSAEAGLSLLREIKNNADLKNIKVVIFSGHTDKNAIEEAKKIGADMYLAKEEHLPQDLMKVIDNIMHEIRK
ncbi:MAG: response regulator [Patescibacteria group bacterium]|nr:response regulator [Patescibacteria group bacterium]